MSWSWISILGALAVGIGVLLLAAYIAVFMFVGGEGTKRGLNQKQDEFIMKTCSNSEQSFFASVKTWGYLKASFRRFWVHYRRVILSRPPVQVGKAAPDARLVSLQGSDRSLLRDYVQKMPQGMPLILNMGSYT